ncbi:hypothetical protein [Asticcacaulis sp. YBE204]|uniref:hypothetical protein n=1 Tax=Asticcacaulis sp. YBE204 TaxID=1282363 RepID=UPI0003C3C8B7|nr:hypothetical protein [Asticcacaulis sp. YBE204]ESQ81203.1 hypothetical protein AEYBE204_02385 [Asticcacaulis sp. YBE204]
MTRLHLLHLIWLYGGNVLALLIGIWALWRGGKTERLGTVVLWGGWIATPLVQTPHAGIDIGILIVDLIVTAGFFWLSLTSRKLWMAFATAFMVMAVASHFAPLLTRYVSLYVYITANGFWGGLAVLGAFLAGMLQVEKERHKARPLRRVSAR